jgi:hypothetical protein
MLAPVLDGYPAWRRGMVRCRAALILLVLAPACACAQRYGRPDSLEHYLPKPPNPILNIDNQSARTWTHARLSDLLRMKRVEVLVSDPKTNRTSLYEGTLLSRLVPGIAHYRVDIYRDFWAFRDKLAASSADLDPRADLIVVDTINGKRLGPDHPFCLIARNKRGDPVVIRELAYIRLADAR